MRLDLLAGEVAKNLRFQYDCLSSGFLGSCEDMKAKRHGRTGKMLSISARDFAEFVVLYENSCECDAFSSVDDNDVHAELIDASAELLDAMTNAICSSSKNPRSLEELCLVLDLAVGPEWNGEVEAGFWLEVLACLGSSQEDCFSINLMAVTFANPSILVAGMQAGFFDRHVLADDLASFLCQLSECPCDDAAVAWLSSGAGILEIARAWEARRSHLLSSCC